MISSRSAFWYGVLGSLIPELIRWGKLIGYVNSPTPEKITAPPFGWLVYFVCAVIYSLAAGMMTRAWKLDTEWKAVWVGASFPALMMKLIATPPTHS
jgi:hypothetical protein